MIFIFVWWSLLEVFDLLLLIYDFEIIISIWGILFLVLLNNLLVVIFNVLLLYVCVLGYGMLFMVVFIFVFDLDLLKLYLYLFFCDMMIILIFVLVGEILKGLVRDFINFKIFLKLFGLYLFMFLDLLIRNLILIWFLKVRNKSWYVYLKKCCYKVEG